MGGSLPRYLQISFASRLDSVFEMSRGTGVDLPCCSLCSTVFLRRTTL